jgi:hypothetical protein
MHETGFPIIFLLDPPLHPHDPSKSTLVNGSVFRESGTAVSTWSLCRGVYTRYRLRMLKEYYNFVRLQTVYEQQAL